VTPFITRACLAASVVLCFAIEPASAQYNVFNNRNGRVTDVIVNGKPATLDEVVSFEKRCGVDIAAGRWWADNNGNLGREGEPAQYNQISCQFLGQNPVPAAPEKKPENHCTFFPGQGSICSGPGFR
jgi:hypothetical protein